MDSRLDVTQGFNDRNFWQLVVCRNLKRYRLSAGISQPRLAEMVTSLGYKLHSSQVCRLEQFAEGKNDPRQSCALRVDLLVRLAVALNVTVDDLLRVGSDDD